MRKISDWLSQEVIDLSEDEKKVLFAEFLFLVDSVESIFGMQEPWLLIIDNQILNDLKYREANKENHKNRTRYIRLISTFMIFEFLNQYSRREFKAVLTPCILYEFNYREIPNSKKIFDESLVGIYGLLHELGIEEFFCLNIEGYKKTQKIIKDIIHDEKIILRTLRRLKQKKMSFDLYQKSSSKIENNKKAKIEFIEPPFLKAKKIVSKQRMNLRYFNRGIVNHVVACHLEEIVYKDSIDTKELREKFKGFRNMDMKKTASISKVSNGTLKGLADIELIQYCNVSMQFTDNWWHTLYAITFDRKLAELLKNRTHLSASSMWMSGEDSLETLKNKESIFFEDIQRINSINTKSKEDYSDLYQFYKDLGSLF